MKITSLVDRIITKSTPVIKTSFDPIKFVSEVGALMSSLSVHKTLGMHQAIERDEDMIIGVVESGAYEGVLSNWDYSDFLKHYPEFKYFFDNAELELAAKAEADNYYNHHRNFNGVGKVTVYCPRGCNCIEVSAQFPWEECAACGTRMTPRNDHDAPCIDSTWKLSLVSSS